MGQPDPVEPVSAKTDSATVQSEPIDKENCSCKGIPLYGRVQVKNSHADFKVEVVNSNPDLYVEVLTVSRSYPECGQWEFVEISPDFTVEFTDVSADFRITYVTISPGIR